MKLHSHFHSVYDINLHLVLVTKYRRKCITKEMHQELKSIIDRLMNDKDLILVEYGGEEDHIHVLFSTHLNINLSRFINTIKTVSSRLIRKKHPDHLSKFYWKPYFWSRSYCVVSSGGAPIETIKKYIQKQDKYKT